MMDAQPNTSSPVMWHGFSPLHAPLPIVHAHVEVDRWTPLAEAVRRGHGRLLALWAGGSIPQTIHAAYATRLGAFWVSLHGQDYPDVSAVFPSATRMQRAIADLSGLHATGSTDTRPWLNHGAWADSPTASAEPYAFVPVQGDGVHEIPVGPVHAGIIEPGHFRFSVVGEKILRLEERLGYTHKGIERRMTELPPLEAHCLAGRVCGDSTVAYTWAYCMALESATQTTPSARANTLRAVMLERERVANHLGDLGAIANDVAFAFGLAQFSRLREDWLRISTLVDSHRWMMDAIVPGGVRHDLDAAQCSALIRLCDSTGHEAQILHGIYEAHAGLQDRFVTTGRVLPALAAQLGMTGLAGRASNQAHDLRCDHSWGPYETCPVRKAVHHNGDVAARVAVRFDELLESLRLIRHWLQNLPQGPVAVPVQLPDQTTLGAGWVEGWRGEVWVALELGRTGGDHRLLRCHLHDPSWQNWPALEHAVMGNIVPDFPLINKSFNLSYSGHDL